MYFLPAIQFQFDAFFRMGAPAGEEGEVEELIGTMQYAIETGQAETVASGNELAKLFARFNQLARDYGVDRCTIDRSHYAPLWTVVEKGLPGP